MLKLAWFAPRTPQPQSARGALRHRLADRHAIRVFSDYTGTSGPRDPTVSDAHEFPWRRHQDGYDVTVFELADHRDYDFVWPYLVRYPGLVLLHDGRLHAARGNHLHRYNRFNDYCEEFAYSHPGVGEDAPRLCPSGHFDLVRELWPMRRTVVESSRWLVTPDPWVAEEIRSEASHQRIGVVGPGLPEFAVSSVDRDQVRHQLDVTPETVVVAAMIPWDDGGRTIETLRAFAELDPDRFPACLVLPHGDLERPELRQVLRDAGLDDQRVRGHRPDQLTDVERIAAADVCVCLQWPARSDGVWRWLECLAAGRSTIGFDLADHVGLPTLDPRDGQTRRPAPREVALPDPGKPVGVGVDIVDEAHSLRLALQQLVRDRALRTRLGTNARHVWDRCFRLERMVEEMDRAIRKAATTPLEGLVRDELPSHVLADGSEKGRATLEDFTALGDLRASLPWPFDEPSGRRR